MPSPLIALQWLCVCLALVFNPGRASAAQEVRGIAEALFVLAEDELPPADDRGWSTVRLPDNWSSSRPNAQGIGWYRIDLQIEGLSGRAPDERTAILIKRLSMNAEFFVNGVRVMSGGQMTDPVTRNWNVPFFFEIPAPLLHSGRNTLHIRLFAYRNYNSGLGTVYVGDPAKLRMQYVSIYARHVEGAVFSFAVALVAAFISLLAWWRMGREAVYGFFCLAMAAWGVRYANYFVQDVPIDHTVYSIAVNSAQGWFFVFFTSFFLRLAHLRWPWVEQTLLAFGIAGTLAIYAALQGWASLQLVVVLWSFVWLPCSLALLVVSARYAYKTRSVLAWLAALVVWTYVPLTLRELLITSNFMPFDGSYVAHYVGVPLAVLISCMLIERAVAAARDAAQADVARACATFDERQRITQDMHDGLGLQLNAALRAIERGSFDRARGAEVIRSCLDELRLIVDSSDVEAGDFLLLLASLRIRLQTRLEAAGIRIQWQMEKFPQGINLPPGTALQLLRIVQEAINNTVKHANATVIAFELAPAVKPGHIGLSVRDNGSGFAPEAHNIGKGLNGMKRRATAAGVGLTIESAAIGTRIQIDIPDPTTFHAALQLER